jgi:hypothetical protein
MNCINKNSKEFKTLLQASGISDLHLAAKISLWQDKNGVDNWPTVSDLGLRSNIKPGVQDVFDSNPELANIGTQSQYSQYLDTIFPDSKVKDIVYHGSPIKNITKFNKGNIYFTNETDEAFNLGLEKFWTNLPSNIKQYFLENTTDTYKNSYGLFEWTLVQAKNKKNNKPVERGIERHIQFLQDNNIIDDNFDFTQIVSTYPSILNIKDPNFLKEGKRFFKDFKKDGYTGDGIIGKDVMPLMSDNRTDTVYLVFEPEQIHILGSKQDIEGFREFVDKDSMNQLSSSDIAPSNELDSIIKSFLDKIGVRIDDIEGADFVAKAKIAEKIIQVVRGKADIKTLPEEATHFFVALLKRNSTLYQKMASDIDGTEFFNKVYEEYKGRYLNDDGTVNRDKILEEAVVKRITDDIVKLYQSGFTTRTESSKPKNIFERAWDIIKGIINKGLSSLKITSLQPYIDKMEGTGNLFTKAAENILKGNIEGMNLDLSKDNYEMLQAVNTTQSELHKAIVDSQARFEEFTTKVGNETRHGYKLDPRTDKERKIFTTPSVVASQDSRKRFRRSNYKSGNIKEFENIQATLGTKAHTWIQEIVKNITLDSEFNSIYESLSPLDKTHYNKIVPKIKALIEDIRKEDPSAIFLTEVAVFDPRFKWVDDYNKTQYGLAGKIDLLVLHGDGTVSIYDWKTTSKGVKFDDISIYKSFEYNLQVGLYKRALMDGNGLMNVPRAKGIRKSRLYQIHVKAGENGTIQQLEMVGEIPVAGEKTGIPSLDAKLSVLYERFYKLMKSKAPKDKVMREAHYARINSIRDTIVTLHLRKSYAVILDNAVDDLNHVNKLLNKEDIDFSDLNTAKEITDMYSDILDYIDGTALNADTRTKLANVAVNARSLSSKITDKRIDMMQTVADSYDIQDKVSDVLPSASFLEANFRSFSTVQHPMIATLYEMVKKANYTTELEANKLRDDIIKEREKVSSWASRNGLSLQEAVDKVINKKKGTLIGEIKAEFYNERDKAKLEGNKQWFKDNIEFNKEAYTKALDNFKERIKKEPLSRNPIKNIEFQNQKIREFEEYEGNILTSNYTKIKDSRKAYWATEEWKLLNRPENKELLDFHKFFSGKIKELSEWMPSFGNTNNFIPSVRKLWMEQLSLAGIKQGSSLLEQLKSRISVSELNANQGEIDATTGTVGGKVPLYFVNPMDPNEKSYDLFRVLQIFGEMSYNFKNMSEIEDAAITGLEVLKTIPSYETGLGGKVIRSSITQDLQSSLEANKSWVETYKTFMDFYVYGVTTKNPSVLTNLLDNLSRYTSFKLLGLSVFPAAAAVIANTSNTFTQSGRSVYFPARDWAKANRVLAGGKVGLGGQDKDIVYALIDLLKAPMDNKYTQKNRALSTKVAVRHVSIDLWFTLLREPDILNQNATTIALLYNSTIIDGKIVLFSDYKKALRPKGFYDLSKEEQKRITKEIDSKMKTVKSVIEMASVDKDGNLSLEDNTELSIDSILSFRQLSRQLNKNIIGNMDPSDVIAAKSNAYIRPFLLFRNWMPRMIEERYGELRYNRELRRWELGRYNSMFKQMFNAYRDEANNLRFAILIGAEQAARIEYFKRGLDPEKISLDEFIDLYKENMGASWRGLTMTMAVLLLMTALIGAKFDDDDEEYNLVEKSITAVGLDGLFRHKIFKKLVKRAWSEIALFANPVEALNILKSPTAAMAPLVQIVKVFEHGTKELVGAALGDDEMRKKAQPGRLFLETINPFDRVERFYRDFDEDYDKWVRGVGQNEN